MTNQTMKRAVAIAIAGATVVGSISPAWSAVVLSNTAALKAAAPVTVTDVRYGGHRYYRNNGAGVALGILGVVGAVAAASAYRHNPYGYGYGYPGYYQQGYNPYYAPNYYGRHYSW
jgi:hypothetical protein